MSQDIENFRKLKAHLKRIAKRNEDEFDTCVTWTEKGYVLEVKEAANKHTFLTVWASDIFILIDRAEGALRAACAGWDYDYVE